eukprot:2304424-Amphidinium_carterae.1
MLLQVCVQPVETRSSGKRKPSIKRDDPKCGVAVNLIAHWQVSNAPQSGSCASAPCLQYVLFDYFGGVEDSTRGWCLGHGAGIKAISAHQASCRSEPLRPLRSEALKI